MEGRRSKHPQQRNLRLREHRHTIMCLCRGPHQKKKKNLLLEGYKSCCKTDIRSSAMLQHCKSIVAARPSQRVRRTSLRPFTRADRNGGVSIATTSTRIDPLLQQQCKRCVTTVAQQESSWNEHNASWWPVGAAVATGLAGVASVFSWQQSAAHCEEAAKDKIGEDSAAEKESNEEENKYKIGPDDPYYEIPEEDEPTDCQMCLTFRQGPCRTEWKRFEMCAKDKTPSLNGEEQKEGDKDKEKDEDLKKDNEEQDSDALACMKYAMPFYDCSSKYVNTYIILGNELTFQKVIRPLHESFSSQEAQSRRLCWVENPQLNWQGWDYFLSKLEELGSGMPQKFKLEKTGFNSPAEAVKATWNKDDGKQYLMMDSDNEPYLITVAAHVPKRQGEETLMMTWALDQHGNLLGDKRYDEEDEAKKNEDAKVDEEAKETSSNVDLSIQLLPGVTESITIYGVYVPGNDADFLTEGKLYESKPYPVPQSSKKTTKQTKKATKKKKKTAKKDLEE